MFNAIVVATLRCLRQSIAGPPGLQEVEGYAERLRRAARRLLPVWRPGATHITL